MVLKITGIAAGVIILLVIAVGVGAYFGVIPNPFLNMFLKPPEDSARYYPEDTLAYAWLTLQPGGGQREQMLDVWERFNEFRVFRNRLDDLFDEFEDESGIDFEQDVFPWAGPEFSAGVIELNRYSEPVVAATVGVRDADAARVFLDQWLDFLEDTAGADFDADSYRGIDTWLDENSGQAYALSRSLLVIVDSGDDSESVLEEILELVDGAARPSLADSADFQSARAALPDRRFASVYVNVRGALADAEELVGDATMGFLGETGRAPNWVAASAQWIERGMILETVAPNTDGYGQNLAPLSDSARLLPEDTLGFAAATFDPDLDNWRAELAEYPVDDLLGYEGAVYELYQTLYWLAAPEQNQPPQLEENPDLVDVLELALELVDNATGIDLETDFFDHLGGEAVLAVNDFDFNRVERDPVNNPVDVVAMLSYQSESEVALADTMDKAAGLLEDYTGLDADPANVGADNQARTFDLDSFGADYTPGYVLHNGYLTLGTTEDALERIVAAQQGGVANLAATGEYGRAAGHLPANRQFLAWVDLQGIVAQLDAEEIDLPRDEYRLFRDSAGAVAVSVNADVDYIRAALVLTLFPE